MGNITNNKKKLLKIEYKTLECKKVLHQHYKKGKKKVAQPLKTIRAAGELTVGGVRHQAVWHCESRNEGEEHHAVHGGGAAGRGAEARKRAR